MQQLVASLRDITDRRWVLFLLLLPLAVAINLLWAYDRAPPIEFLGGEVQPSVVGQGEKITLIREAIVNRPCRGFTYRQITDAKGYVHILDRTPTRSSETISSKNQQMLVGSTFALPTSIAPGPAKFKTRIEYHCPWLFFDESPIQRVWPVKVMLPDLSFEVSP